MTDEPFWRKMAASQRAQEQPHTPNFERMLARAQREPLPNVESAPRQHRGQRVFTGVFALAAATFIALLIIQPSPHHHATKTTPLADAAVREALKREIDQAIVSLQAQPSDGPATFAWHSSTDFLLSANNYHNTSNP